MSDKTNPLIGKVVKKADLANDGESITFTIADGDTITATTEGDCCSHTWIEDFLNPEALIDAEVMEVEDLELPEEFCGKTKTTNDEEEMAYYGLAIKTTKGTATLAYRNSSNGYYGGWLNW